MAVIRNNSTARHAHRNVPQPDVQPDVLNTGLLSRLRSRIVQQTFVYAVVALDGFEPPRTDDDGKVAIDVVPARDIDWIGTIGPIDRAEVASRVDRGDKCYGAFVDGKLAHFSWVQTSGAHPIDSAGVVKPVADGAFWIYNCRTSETHRGFGLYARTIRRIVKDAFVAGANIGWIYTSSTNIASQRGIAKAGFVQRETLQAVRVGRRYLALT